MRTIEEIAGEVRRMLNLLGVADVRITVSHYGGDDEKDPATLSMECGVELRRGAVLNRGIMVVETRGYVFTLYDDSRGEIIEETQFAGDIDAIHRIVSAHLDYCVEQQMRQLADDDLAKAMEQEQALVREYDAQQGVPCSRCGRK